MAQLQALAVAPMGVLLCALLFGPEAVAQNGVPYTFFNPTPDSRLREFSPDRPDLTEGPFTIDPGRFQTESDIVNYSRSRRDEEGTYTEKFLFGATTVRIGLTHNAEVALVLQPFNALRTHMIDPRRTTWRAGPDVLQVRSKINFFGNDTYKDPGASALGIIHFINIPTFRNGVGSEDVEGGVALPFAYKVSDKVDFGAMTQVEFIKNDGRPGYHAEYVNSAVVAYQIDSRWSTYAEVFTRFGNEGPSGDIVVVGGGFMYKLKDNLQLDFGINVGLTRAADAVNPFVGISKRY
ncbi:MAG: transporter [Hyphomicrobiales bacterium]|nr:transporter [Hyphomicrobiales bacterium]